MIIYQPMNFPNKQAMAIPKNSAPHKPQIKAVKLTRKSPHVGKTSEIKWKTSRRKTQAPKVHKSNSMQVMQWTNDSIGSNKLT